MSQIADRRRDIVELHRQLVTQFAVAAQWVSDPICQPWTKIYSTYSDKDRIMLTIESIPAWKTRRKILGMSAILLPFVEGFQSELTRRQRLPD